MFRIYADFNHCDPQGRVILDTIGSLADIQIYEAHLIEGMNVILYMEDEFEVEGALVFEDVWLAVPDSATLRYLCSREKE